MLFDVAVLGKESAGLEVALHAAELGQRVAVVDDRDHFGPLPDSRKDWKSFEAIREFSGATQFLTQDSLEVRGHQTTHRIQARRFVLACGSRAKRPQHIGFDGRRILDSDEIAARQFSSQSWLIVGAGEHGVNAARQLLATGARVSIVDQSPPDLCHARSGVSQVIRELGCPVHWGTTILGAERHHSVVRVYYENGSIETFDGVVFSVGRVGCTAHLRLPRPDLLLDETQRVWCNEVGQTGIPHIYAVGSVVGFPQEGASFEQQADRVIEHMFQEEVPASLWRSPNRRKGMVTNR